MTASLNVLTPITDVVSVIQATQSNDLRSFFLLCRVKFILIIKNQIFRKVSLAASSELRCSYFFANKLKFKFLNDILMIFPKL